MSKMHVLFFVLALAISANHCARSTTTITKKSDVVDPMTNTTSTWDEERGTQVITLLGKEIPVVLPEPVKKTVETQRNPITILGHEIRPDAVVPTPPKTITLFGKTIPVPEPTPPETITLFGKTIPVPEPTPQETTTLFRETIPVPDPMEPLTAKTSTLFGETIPVAAPVHPEKVDHSARGVKRKRTRVRKKVTGRTIAIRPGYTPKLSDLIKVWHIDATQIKERKREISIQLVQRKKEIARLKLRDNLHFTNQEVNCMAIGSIFFERKLDVLPISSRETRYLLTNQLKKLDDSRLEQLGVEREKLDKKAYHMFHNELDLPRNEYIVYMALGKEFYDLLHLSR